MEANEDNYKEEIERTYEVQDDGTVLVHEIHKSTTKFQAKDFRSFYSEHIKKKEDIETQLGDEQRKKMETDLKTITIRMKEMKPFVEQAEAKTAENYKKKKMKRALERFREEMAKKKHERQSEYLLEAYNNIRDNEEEAFKQLTLEEKNEMIRIKKRIMEQERAGKKK